MACGEHGLGEIGVADMTLHQFTSWTGWVNFFFQEPAVDVFSARIQATLGQQPACYSLSYGKSRPMLQQISKSVTVSNLS